MFVYPLVRDHVGGSICLSACVFVCAHVCVFEFDFTAKPPLLLTLWAASPHFVHRLVPYLLEWLSLSTIVRKGANAYHL